MSLPGGNKSPYRAPCDGTVLCGVGPRYQNGRPSEQNISVWLYDGVVPDWADEDNFIPPYERDVPLNTCTGGACSGVDTCPDPTSAAPPCLQWIGVEPTAACEYACQYLQTSAAPNPIPTSWYQPKMMAVATIADGGAGYHLGDTMPPSGGVTDSSYLGPEGGYAAMTVTAIDEAGAITGIEISNTGCYQTAPSGTVGLVAGHGTGATVNVAFVNKTISMVVCQKYGYKNVQARRQWHGIPGFFASPVGIYTCADGSIVQFEPYSDTAPQSKYTSAAFDIYQVQSLMDGSDNYDYSGESSWTASVDPLTGLQSISDLSVLDSCAGFSDGSRLPEYALNVNGEIGFAQTVSITNLIDVLEEAIASTYDDGAFTGALVYINADGSGGAAYDAGYAYAQFYGVDNCCYGANYYEWSASDSEIVFNQYNTLVDDTGISGYINTTITVTLSGSNSASDIQADLTTLLDEWDLTNDTQYSWRTDNHTSIAPLVTRNEVPDDVNPMGFGPTMNGSPVDDCGGNAPWNPSWSPSYGSGLAADAIADCDGNDPCSDGWTPTYSSSLYDANPLNDCEGNQPWNPAWGDSALFLFPVYEQLVATDSNAAYYDGSILGAPMPAGYQGFFDFAAVDWQICETSDPIGFYIAGWGIKNAGQYGIPLTATQWTDLPTAAQYGSGAWLFCDLNPSWQSCGTFTYPPATVCIAQKWAETKMGFASENFFRPAAADRFVYDETQVYSICATANMGMGPGGNNQGAQISLEQTANCGSVLSLSGSGLWGGPAVSGFYEISSVSPPTGSGCDNACVVTLGAQVYNVPDNWVSAGDGDDAYCFGKLRFSTGAGDPPAILGRAGVSAIAEYESMPDVTQLNTDALPTLGMLVTDNDYIDVYDQSMTLISGNLAVTRGDDSHFTVPVAVGTLTGATWIMSHGAPAYYWDDQFPKGDYAYTDWTWWPRLICSAQNINTVNAACTGGDSCSVCPDTETVYTYPFSAFTQEAGCVPFNPCNPSVLCISPNGESFPNGTTYDFPAVDFDNQYGAGWQAEIQQVMQDLFYQNPHYPAQGSGCTADPFQWTPDNGTCQDDSDGSPPIKYYPYPPLVECRITVPAGAPALPGSIVIGWSSPVGIVSGDPIPDNTLLPNTSNGTINDENGFGLTSPTLWGTWVEECGCIGADGRFAAEYANDVVGCI